MHLSLAVLWLSQPTTVLKEKKIGAGEDQVVEVLLIEKHI